MAKPRTEAEQRAVQTKLDDVLTAAGLPTDSRLRKILDEESEIVDIGRESVPRIITRSGDDISHAARLEELKQDSMYKGAFPKPKTTVDKRDLRTMSEHFDEIASGKITVK
jgi:hypothetical protein